MAAHDDHGVWKGDVEPQPLPPRMSFHVNHGQSRPRVRRGDVLAAGPDVPVVKKLKPVADARVASGRAPLWSLSL